MMESKEKIQRKESNIGLEYIKESYKDDFIQEILVTLDSIELELVNLEVEPDNTAYLNAVYSNFHAVRGLSGFLEDNLATQITEQTESLIEKCRKFNLSATRNTINAILQSVLFLRKICNQVPLVHETKFQGEVEQHLLNIQQLRDEIMLEVKQPVRSPENKIGEILVEEGAIAKQDVDDVLQKQSSIYQKMKFGEIAVREKKVEAGELIKAIRAQKIRNESSEQLVHIPIKQLDEILGILMKLTSIQNNLQHESVLLFGSDNAFSTGLKRAENMVLDIHRIIRELSMVTLKQSFQKLSRAVRAMIEDAGLHVAFSIIGENTELSKEVADELTVPLAEIMGCMLSSFVPEPAGKRGKLGNIEVVAYNKEDSVMIEISNSKAPDILNNQHKLEALRNKIEKLNGRLEYEVVDDGCKVTIILPA
ncbi:MAG: hypothetical protein GX144_13985 [Clostridiaceae bacterium]|nr:hypothetical protein [Clostridiaceae bacterium]